VIPGEEEAGERAWTVARRAFAEHQPTPRPSHWPRVAAVAFAVAAVGAAAFSTPGRAVLGEIREVVGVERAQPALFSLPAQGRLLVSSDAGVWVVSKDGGKRLLGDYREASWSPFGRFVIAASEHELAALEPDGDVRWTLARPDVRSPRWIGTERNTRIAYVDSTGLRIVAGDGTGDRLLLPGFRGLQAWQPGDAFVLALVTPRQVRVLDSETGRTLWRKARNGTHPTEVSWSSDGRRLLVASRGSATVYDARGAVTYELGPGAAPIDAAALAPDGRSLVLAQGTSGRAQLWIVPRVRPDASAARRLFGGVGTFDTATWSPDGRWVVAGWDAADQWVFLRADGGAIRAVANVSQGFRSNALPRVEGWCCAP
jgi:hypothetical protein